MATAESPTLSSPTTHSPLRVQVVARSYWPISDEPSQRLMHTLDAWNTIGIQSSVLTTRWNNNWPDKAALRSVRVERLLPAPTSSWNETHFQRNLTKWLVKSADTFDAIYVDAADSLLSAIVPKATAMGKPVLCRDSHDQASCPIPRSLGTYFPSNPSISDSLRKCAAVVADHRRGYQDLIEMGVSKERSVWIPDAVFEPAQRSEAKRAMARNALFDVSGDLAIPTQTHLLLHFGETSLSQLQVVLQSICDLLDRGIPVRMWLINPGQDAPKIYEWLRLQGWHREVLIFDGFDVLEDLICIADLVLVSNPACSLQYSTRLALESQVPLIAALDPRVSDWMPETPLMKWYYSRESLGDQLTDWIAHRAQWEAQAVALRRHYQRHHPTSHWLDRWSSIFAKALSQSSSSPAEKRSK